MSEKITLENVLHDFAYESGGNNRSAMLRKYMDQYPEYSEELIEFAASQSLLKHSPEADLTEEEDARARAIGSQTLQSFLKKNSGAILSLNGLAEEQGLNKKAFAAALGVSISLLTYLEKKRLDAATIPRDLVNRIAGLISTTEDLVSEYLSGHSKLSPGTSFKAKMRPEISSANLPDPQTPQTDLPIAGKKSFSQAVTEDQVLSDEQKRELLILK